MMLKLNTLVLIVKPCNQPVCSCKDEADEKDAVAAVNKQEDTAFGNNAMAEAFKAAKGE